MSGDPYLDPQTGVLRNRLGFVDADPFREGNGRTQRAFFGQLARDPGYRIDWSTMEPQANLAASQASIRGDDAPLRAMLDPLVDRPDR